MDEPRPSPSFYKRPLPPTCVAFASNEGKELFSLGLRAGTMESYFPLAAQFVTQNEPAFCGLGTLTMILNALEMDPQRKWKGPWRWYEQEMLDCCRPLSAVKEVGITLNEFACLARCNGLKSEAYSPNPASSPAEHAAGLAQFRRHVKEVSKQTETVMALSYSRKAIGQTGSGHFSPLGGYCEEQDQLLVLDVARFKHGPHFVSVEQLWNAMLPVDDATGKPRGYVLLSVPPANNPTSLAAPPSQTTLTLNKASWAALSGTLSTLILTTRPPTSPSQFLQTVLQHLRSHPTPVLAPRSPTGALATLTPSLMNTNLAKAAACSQSTEVLALMTLFSEKSSLPALVPPAIAGPVQTLVRDALAHDESIRTEWEVLSTQLEALSQCCMSDGRDAACGCATVK